MNSADTLITISQAEARNTYLDELKRHRETVMRLGVHYEQKLAMLNLELSHFIGMVEFMHSNASPELKPQIVRLIEQYKTQNSN